MTGFQGTYPKLLLLDLLQLTLKDLFSLARIAKVASMEKYIQFRFKSFRLPFVALICKVAHRRLKWYHEGTTLLNANAIQSYDKHLRCFYE